jgi:ribonuclease P protein component
LVAIPDRAAFLRANAGKRAGAPGFLVLHRQPEEEAPLRFGFTVTKKIGNAPERNRIRRRLREAVRAASGELAGVKGDFVIIARREAISLDFEVLAGALVRAVRLLSGGGGAPSRPRR